mgnify:CR=1 FL=1
MRELHLVYNSLSKGYVYYEGKKDGPQHNRQEWNPSELIYGLKQTLPLKRKGQSFLYLSGIDGKIFLEIYKLLKGSKISLEAKSQSN